MGRNRQIKIITIIALVVAISGLSIGFAAFTSVLTISSTATVTPDESAFSVLFSSSGTSQATAQITPTVSGATGDKATISGTTISGLKANFTEPGQTVTYAFWSHNAGSYTAYLRNISYETATSGSTFKYCTPGTNATESLVAAACEDINVTVSVGSTNASDTIGVTNHPLAVNAYEQVIVTITYASDGERADGEFNVLFGDITLNYSSIDGGKQIITFEVEDYGEFQAENGMTWLQWFESDYNTSNFYIHNESWICNIDNDKPIIKNINEKIIDNQYYSIIADKCSEI